MPRHKSRFAKANHRSRYIHTPYLNGKVDKNHHKNDINSLVPDQDLARYSKIVTREVDDNLGATPHEKGIWKIHTTCTHFNTSLCEVEVVKEEYDSDLFHENKHNCIQKILDSMTNICCVSMCTSNYLPKRISKTWLIGELLHGRKESLHIRGDFAIDKRVLFKVLFPPNVSLRVVVNSVNMLVNRMRECGVPCDEYVCVGETKYLKNNRISMLTSWNALDVLRMTGLSTHFIPGIKITTRMTGVRKHKKLSLAYLLLRLYGTVSIGSLKEKSKNGDSYTKIKGGTWCKCDVVCSSTKKTSVLESIPEKRMIRVLNSHDYDPIRLYNFIAIVNSWCALLCNNQSHVTTTYPSESHFKLYSKLHIFLNMIFTKKNSSSDAQWIAEQRKNIYRWEYFKKHSIDKEETEDMETMTSSTRRNCVHEENSDRYGNAEKREDILKSDAKYRLDFIENVCKKVYAFINPDTITTIAVHVMVKIKTLFRGIMFSTQKDHRAFYMYAVKRYERVMFVCDYIDSIIRNNSSLHVVHIKDIVNSNNLLFNQDRQTDKKLYTCIDFLNDLFSFLFEPFISSNYDIYDLVCEILKRSKNIQTSAKEEEKAAKSYFRHQRRITKYELYSKQYANAILRDIPYEEDGCISRLRDESGLREPVYSLYEFLRMLDRCVMEDCRNVTTDIFMKDGLTLSCKEYSVPSSVAKINGVVKKDKMESNTTSFKINDKLHIPSMDSTDILETKDYSFPVCSSRICNHYGEHKRDTIMYYEKCFFLVQI